MNVKVVVISTSTLLRVRLMRRNKITKKLDIHAKITDDRAKKCCNTCHRSAKLSWTRHPNNTSQETPAQIGRRQRSWRLLSWPDGVRTRLPPQTAQKDFSGKSWKRNVWVCQDDYGEEDKPAGGRQHPLAWSISVCAFLGIVKNNGISRATRFEDFLVEEIAIPWARSLHVIHKEPDVRLILQCLCFGQGKI